MPLLDHFRSPLAEDRHWESFHAFWAGDIATLLNVSVLPAGYFAETQVHIGSRVEVDVASFKRPAGPTPMPGANGGVAVEAWAPPATSRVMPALFPDEIEVQVFQTEGGSTLVAAIELISPRNKDRPEARRAFAAKCLAHLQMGIGLLILDIVSSRQFNLHDELVELLGDPSQRFPEEARLYAVSYRPFRTSESDQIEFWPAQLVVGQNLPTLPLPLRGGPTLPVDLEASYTEARRRSRL